VFAALEEPQGRVEGGLIDPVPVALQPGAKLSAGDVEAPLLEQDPPPLLELLALLPIEGPLVLKGRRRSQQAPDGVHQQDVLWRLAQVAGELLLPGVVAQPGREDQLLGEPDAQARVAQELLAAKLQADLVAAVQPEPHPEPVSGPVELRQLQAGGRAGSRRGPKPLAEEALPLSGLGDADEPEAPGLDEASGHRAALVEEGVPVIVICPSDAQFEKTRSYIQQVRSRGARVTAITDAQGAQALKQDAHRLIVVPDTDQVLQPLVCAVVVQLIAYHVAVYKGTDVDQPRNLAKSVTVE